MICLDFHSNIARGFAYITDYSEDRMVATSFNGHGDLVVIRGDGTMIRVILYTTVTPWNKV